MLKAYHEKIWAILGEVGSIIMARLTMFTGLVTGAIGFIDWSPMLSLFGTTTSFSREAVMGTGATIFVKGLADEITRRYNDPLLKVTKAADQAPEVAIAKKKIKKVLAKTPEVK